ncbi:MAG: hypothetical protein J0H17_10695 [Rhizobiales bacterium]|nr:hypothetical protein [Hyphomicrobiales bacterium]
MSDQTDSNLPQTNDTAPAQAEPDAPAQSVSEHALPAVAPSDPEKDDIAAWLDTFADVPDDGAHSPPDASPPPAARALIGRARLATLHMGGGNA